MSMHASRRTIVRGMVWGAPAIAVVAAAPAYAASGAAYSVSARRSDRRLVLTITSSPTGQSISGISVSYDNVTRSGGPSSGTTSHTWISNNNVPNNESGTVTFIAGGSTITLNFSI